MHRRAGRPPRAARRRRSRPVGDRTRSTGPLDAIGRSLGPAPDGDRAGGAGVGDAREAARRRRRGRRVSAPSTRYGGPRGRGATASAEPSGCGLPRVANASAEAAAVADEPLDLLGRGGR